MCDCANPILLGDVYKGSCCCLCILSTDITHQRPDMCRTLLGGWVCSSTLCVLFHIECNAKHGHSRGIDCQRFFNSSKCFNLFDNYKKNFIVKIVYIHKFSSPSPAWDSTIPLTSGNKKKQKKKTHRSPASPSSAPSHRHKRTNSPYIIGPKGQRLRFE